MKKRCYLLDRVKKEVYNGFILFLIIVKQNFGAALGLFVVFNNK